MEEFDYNSLKCAKGIKKHLRFDVGQIVYMKSDLKKKCPMTVAKILIFDEDNDYSCEWTTSQKNIETRSFVDKMLME